jgi:hypothetical protein
MYVQRVPSSTLHASLKPLQLSCPTRLTPPAWGVLAAAATGAVCRAFTGQSLTAECSFQQSPTSDSKWSLTADRRLPYLQQPNCVTGQAVLPPWWHPGDTAGRSDRCQALLVLREALLPQDLGQSGQGLPTHAAVEPSIAINSPLWWILVEADGDHCHII